ncbi:HigA family addiction module antitoxin [Bradyrhizobium sp. LjRoot220]|uniref:HigA family addiction module antitoxin n=1 Tax=Bradyrhizobium sp. LjRoot220 TaxID=3342284 RepID=UPI003ECF7E7F
MMIIAGRTANGEKLAPIHPGEVLREEFLTPLGYRQVHWRNCGVPRTRIERLANEETGIAADTLSLSKAFGFAKLWLNLQTDYDIRLPEQWKRKPSRKSKRSDQGCAGHFAQPAAFHARWRVKETPPYSYPFYELCGARP